MDWDDLRVFLVVARHKQLLAAAKTLGINHATVARRVSALEEALGSRLLHRKTNGVELTEEGERTLVFAEAMESASIGATLSTGGDHRIEGTVRIGAPDGFGVGFLAPRLGELAELYPGLRLELVPAPRTFSLSRREADLAVTMQRPKEGRLRARKLTDYRLGLYASVSYLEKHGEPHNLSDLKEHRLVGYVEDLLHSPALDYTSELFTDWRSSVCVSSALGQLTTVAAGGGIGILHTFMARTDPNLRRLLTENSLVRTYWLVQHEDLRGARRVAVVADFISDTVQKNREFF